MPSPSEYIPLVNAQATANRVNTYTPYGSTVFSPVPGAQAQPQAQAQPAKSGGGKASKFVGNKFGPDAMNVAMNRAGGGAGVGGGTGGITPMQSVTSFSPEVKTLFDRQISMAGSPASGAGDSQRIEQATFDRAMNLLNPGFEQQTRDFQQSMADRGLPSGGRAYDSEFANINRAQNSAKEQAAMSAVLAGNDTSFRERGMNMSERGQQFNELASILGQNQVTPTAPLDVMGPANMAMNGNLANQQNQQAKKSSGVNAGSTLGAAYLLSDRRAKEKAVVIGEFVPGVNIYEANYIGNPVRMVCLMSDEVEKVFPEAVVTLDDGFKRVNYGYLMSGRQLNG